MNARCYDENLKYYFKDLSDEGCEPITIDEERELLDKIKNGCEYSKNRLIQSNLRFVVQTALYYSKRHNISLGELISEGNLGLIHALDKFDTEKGVRFITYAGWWIKQHILYYIENDPEQNYLDTEIIMEKMVEGDENEDYDEVFFPELTDSQYLYKEANDNRKILISKLLSSLTDREQMIVKYYYGIGDYNEMNLDEIGELTNLTKERVRQIKKNAISKLKSSILLFDDFNEIYVS